MPSIGPRSGPTSTHAGLPRIVYVLGAVSFCTDLASEMIVPLLPALLASLGGSMLALGVLQGASDLVVALLKIVSGRLSDRQRRRRPWVLAGYGLSTCVRPLFAIVATPLQAVLVRIGDRVGKGLRSAPRDALLAAAVAPSQAGHAFGVQRALDHAGALAGSLVASGLLFAGWQLQSVFLLSLLPGLLAIALIAFFVHDVEAPAGGGTTPAAAAWPAGFPRALAVVAFSAISATIEMFALALAQRLGMPLPWLPLLWVVLHLTRSTLAAPLGRASDRLGRKRVIAAGLCGQVLVLLGFATIAEPAWLWPLFALLGLHAAFTEGAERGLIADLAGGRRRGTAFGAYHAVQGLAAFAGAMVLGVLWDRSGPAAAFSFAAASAGIALLILPAVHVPAPNPPPAAQP